MSTYVDKLIPTTKTSKHSNSAIEMMLILATVKKFWENLKVSDESDAEKVTHNIVGDICRFSTVYFECIINLLVKKNVTTQGGIFQIPFETMITLSNIEFVSKGIQAILIPETEVAPLDEYTKKCLENSFKYGRSLAKTIIKNHINMMGLSIRKLIIEGADVKTEYDKIGERFFTYIEDSLDTLNRELYEVCFSKSRKYLQDKVLDIIMEVIEEGLKMDAEPVFFSNLKLMFNQIQNIFNIENCNKEKIEKIQHFLDDHCLNASKLIHQYYKKRHQMQQEISKTQTDSFGDLVVRCFFFHNTLKIEVLTAENLTTNGNKKINSYVKFNFHPMEKFSNFQAYKTKVKSDTRCSLYDGFFEM